MEKELLNALNSGGFHAKVITPETAASFTECRVSYCLKLLRPTGPSAIAVATGAGNEMNVGS